MEYVRILHLAAKTMEATMGSTLSLVLETGTGLATDVWIFRMVMPNMKATVLLRSYCLYKVQQPSPTLRNSPSPRTTE